MSVSISTLGSKLYYGAVPLCLVLGIALAIWGASGKKKNIGGYGVILPRFSFSFTGISPARTERAGRVQYEEGERPGNIFLTDAPVQEEEQALDVREIQLGMVSVLGEKRYCLTNGKLFKEGAQSKGFIVKRIEPDGVWYRVGSRELFLRTGEKIYCDGNGRPVQPPPAHKTETQPIEPPPVKQTIDKEAL